MLLHCCITDVLVTFNDFLGHFHDGEDFELTLRGRLSLLKLDTHLQLPVGRLPRLKNFHVGVLNFF